MKRAEVGNTDAHKLKRRKYENELRKLQIGLCHLQDWVASRGLKSSSFLKAATPQARRNHPGDKGAGQPTRLSCCRASAAQRTREDTVLCSAIRSTVAGCWRSRDL